LYLHGLGVPKDVELARAYFSTGVAADEPASLNALGLMLLNGVGTSQDVMKGAEYIKRAVDKGHTEAYFNLAMLKLRVRAAVDCFKLVVRTGSAPTVSFCVRVLVRNVTSVAHCNFLQSLRTKAT
jgi:TPR repeat protein